MKILKNFFIILVLVILVIFLYGRYIEVNMLKVREYTIKNNDIPNSFKDLKIIQFSDILYDKQNKNIIKKLVKKVNEEQPDIIIFSGNLFQSDLKYEEEDINYLKDNLKNMEANLYKYAVIGKNDNRYLDQYKDLLYDSNFTLLNNESTLLFYKDKTPINIIGLTDTKNIADLLVKDVEYKYSLAIINEPDYLDEIKNYNINTVISGKSLGGIINIPFYGGIIKRKGANKYLNDYYKVDNTELYVSNGLGYEKFNFRLFNTPSINIYRFSN